ncbi:MAG: M28 family peptidase [Chitinophagaceae bacterium]|jgi:hypothetical protein|nr:M28 family peptidase [Chitinophagaceae bacterium]
MICRLLFFLFFGLLSPYAYAQLPGKKESIKLAGDIVSFLASDSLKGRGNYKPELQIAAGFIEKHFDSIGLKTIPGYNHFAIPVNFKLQPSIFYDLEINKQKINNDHYQLLSASFFVVFDTFQYKKFNFFPSESDWFLLFNDSLSQLLNFETDEEMWVQSLNLPPGQPRKPILIVKNQELPISAKLTIQPSSEEVLMNIVGILPGNKYPEEVILYSAHYDHIPPKRSRRDSIYNGANDNASGTAALIMLAKYFAEKNDNARTLIFCAFSGEELGLLGSKDLVKKLDTDNIIAQINMDMVGISQYKKKGFMLTGSGNSELFQIFSQNLNGSGYKVFRDYDENRNLFKRSDNYPFALMGVPAHTIMTADDSSKCYHQVCDETEIVDMENIANTVEGIIIATTSLVNGTDTPNRIRIKE